MGGMKVNIQDFEDSIDKIILGRGFDYYQDGHILELYQEQQGSYVLEVEGKADYQVVVQLDDSGRITYSYCNCPYSNGPICKHEVAAYYSLRDHINKGKQIKGPEKKQDIEEVLNNLTKEQLIQLFLSIVKEDKTLEETIVLKYGEVDPEQELKRMDKLIASIVRRYVDESGAVYYDESEELVDKLWGLVVYTEPLTGSDKKILLALDMLLLLLETGVELYESVEDDGYLGTYIDDLINRTKEVVTESIKYDEKIKEQIMKKILGKVNGPIFQEWVNYRVQLLKTVLGYGSSEKYREILYKELDKQAKMADCYTNETINLMEFELLQYHGTKHEIDQYIQDHRAIDTFREMLIQNLMERKQYEEAIQVAIEGEEKNKEYSWSGDKWRKLRYEVYKAQGDIDNQEKLAKEFLLQGKIDYYEVLKKLHYKDFDVFYDQLKAELKMKKGIGKYSIFRELIEKENDLEEMITIVRADPEMVKKYIRLLINQYRDEVLTIYISYIENSAVKACDRNMYRDVCYLIADYRRYDNEENVKVLIDKLKKEHKRRPAFIDELNKLNR